jgi:hypothetical protein
MIKAEKLSFELPTDTEWMDLPENLPTNYEVEVDVYKWNINKAVVIIVWKWWTTEWYSNKYVTIANNLLEHHWVNVFVVENPWISWDDPKKFTQCAFNFIDEKMKEFWYSSYKIYAMWFSAWGHFIWRFAYNYQSIEKILLINPVQRVNNTILIKSLNKFKWTWTIIVWDKDPDYFYTPLLDKVTSNIKIVTLKWVNHIFSNEWWLETFIWLAEEYLF